MFFVLSRAWDKEKILSPHKESNLRPSDSACRCSATEPHRLYGERGLLPSPEIKDISSPLTIISSLLYYTPEPNIKRIQYGGDHGSICKEECFVP